MMIFEAASANPATALVSMFQEPSNRWFGLYILSSLLLAFLVYRWQARHDPEVRDQGFFRFAFPKEVYSHRSARVDFKFFIINKLLFGFAFANLVVISHLSSVSVERLLLLASQTPLSGQPAIATISTTVLFILAADFGLWLAHYAFHRVPLLWEFHKVHHSAEVLTPFSAGRVHPLDDLVSYASAGLFGGAAIGFSKHIFGSEAVMLGVLQLNVVLFSFYVLGFHLRHSHVWLPYTGWLGRILISPAHHQVHHSSADRHWDKNMGFIFAIWDWAFRTLYVPERTREKFSYGIGGEEREFNSVLRLYILPFQKAAIRIKRRLAKTDQPQAKPNAI